MRARILHRSSNESFEATSAPEPVDDPVEVALRLPRALVLRQARPAAVLVADGGQIVQIGRGRMQAQEETGKGKDMAA